MVALHFIGLLGGGVRPLMHHRTKERTLSGRARLRPTKRSDRSDNQSEDEDERLNTNHAIRNRTPSAVFVPPASADF